jgi:hypothetical protein
MAHLTTIHAACAGPAAEFVFKQFLGEELKGILRVAIRCGLTGERELRVLGFEYRFPYESAHYIELLSYASALAELAGAVRIVAEPSVEQAAVYQMLFGLQPVAAPKRDAVRNRIVQPVAVALRQLRGYVEYDERIPVAWRQSAERLRRWFSGNPESAAVLEALPAGCP